MQQGSRQYAAAAGRGGGIQRDVAAQAASGDGRQHSNRRRAITVERIFRHNILHEAV